MNSESDPLEQTPQIQPPAPQSDEAKRRVISQTTTKAIRFSGPLPPPGLLAQYNDIIPNGAERMLAMAEKQAAHRENLETQVIQNNLSRQREGSWFAFILVLVALVGGMFLIYAGKNVYGLAAIITALVSLAGVFFFSKYEQRKERHEKATALEARRAAPQPPDKSES